MTTRLQEFLRTTAASSRRQSQSSSQSLSSSSQTSDETPKDFVECVWPITAERRKSTAGRLKTIRESQCLRCRPLLLTVTSQVRDVFGESICTVDVWEDHDSFSSHASLAKESETPSDLWNSLNNPHEIGKGSIDDHLHGARF